MGPSISSSSWASALTPESADVEPQLTQPLKSEATKEMPANKLRKDQEVWPEGIKTATRIRPAVAQHPVTATGKKTAASLSCAPIQTCKGTASGSKTMKKPKAPPVATPVSPGATEGGVGRVDVAAHWDWGSTDMALAHDDEPAVCVKICV